MTWHCIKHGRQNESCRQCHDEAVEFLRQENAALTQRVQELERQRDHYIEDRDALMASERKAREALKKIKPLSDRWMTGGNSLVRAALISVDQIVDDALPQETKDAD